MVTPRFAGSYIFPIPVPERKDIGKETNVRWLYGRNRPTGLGVAGRAAPTDRTSGGSRYPSTSRQSERVRVLVEKTAPILWSVRESVA